MVEPALRAETNLVFGVQQLTGAASSGMDVTDVLQLVVVVHPPIQGPFCHYQVIIP